MELRGVVLIAFSGLCLLAAGLAHQEHKRHGVSQSLAAATQPVRDCMREAITTSSGAVGCFQPVSAAIGSAVLGLTYSGGAAMTRR